jgi:oligoendopeptidase F
MPTRLSRADVPVEATWNLDDLVPSDTAWEAACQAVDGARDAIVGYQGRLADSATTLLACLNAMEALQVQLMRVVMFAHLRNAQDGTHPPHQAADTLQNQFACIQHGVGQIGADLERILRQARADPG